MTKYDFSKLLAKKTGYPRADCMVLIDALFNILRDYIIRGHEINIPGFGRFFTVKRKVRKQWNIDTHRFDYSVTHRTFRFKAFESFKQKIKHH